MIETKPQESFLKIPTDFKSLHDLKDLVSNYDLVSRLSNLLNNYQKAHIDSYLMTMDQVLEYIPEEDYNNYKVTIGDNTIDFLYVSQTETRKDLASLLLFALCQTWDYNYKLYKYEVTISDEAKEEPIFIVNTLKKEINVFYSYSKLSFHKKNNNYYNYNGKVEYEIDEEKILSVKIHFNFISYQQIGGAQIWTGTGRSYFRGGQSLPYKREGHELYQFDTKTNQYLGYVKTEIITPEKEWHKERR